MTVLITLIRNITKGHKKTISKLHVMTTPRKTYAKAEKKHTLNGKNNVSATQFPTHYFELRFYSTVSSSDSTKLNIGIVADKYKFCD